MGIRSYWELFHNAFWGNPGLLKVTPHLCRSSLMRSVGCCNLDSMVFGLISSDRFDVCGDLAILQLQQKRART